jgi:hypothetical protein
MKMAATFHLVREHKSKRGQNDLFFCLKTTSKFVKWILFVVATFSFSTSLF